MCTLTSNDDANEQQVKDIGSIIQISCWVFIFRARWKYVDTSRVILQSEQCTILTRKKNYNTRIRANRDFTSTPLGLIVYE